MASQNEEEKPIVQGEQETSQGAVSSFSISTIVTKLVPKDFIAHPEVLQSLQSRPGHISYSVLAGKYSVILDQETTPEGLVCTTGQPWLSADPNRQFKEPLKMHIECTFLTPNALRVRMGLDSSFPFPDAYPNDPDFPPPSLRQRLFPLGALIDPNAQDSRDDLVCGLSLRSDDGEIWVNPRGSGLELKHVKSPFGLSATWGVAPPPGNKTETATSDTRHDHKDDEERESQSDEKSIHRPLEKPIFELAPLGPFAQGLLPSGIMNNGSALVGTELLILAEGEKLQSGGLGRHRGRNGQQPPLQVKATTALSENWGQDGNESEKIEAGMPYKLPAVGKVEVSGETRELHSSHFSGRWAADPTKLLPPPFIYTDRGWGILMKAPMATSMSPLQDGRAMLGLNVAAGEKGMMEYIIVAGDTLEACKEEYPVEALD